MQTSFTNYAFTNGISNCAHLHDQESDSAASQARRLLLPCNTMPSSLLHAQRHSRYTFQSQTGLAARFAAGRDQRRKTHLTERGIPSSSASCI